MGCKWQFWVGGLIQVISDGDVVIEQAADSHQCRSRACRVGETYLTGLGAVMVVRWHCEQARIKNNIIN